MHMNRPHALMAAPIACLFLILSLCAFVVQRPVSTGVHVPKPRVERHSSWRECEDDMPIFVRIAKDGSTRINQTQERSDEVPPLISKIMEYRETERAVYIMAESDVPFGILANLYSKIATSTTNLHVFLVTDRMRSQLELDYLSGGGICDFEWPENGYKSESRYVPPA